MNLSSIEEDFFLIRAVKKSETWEVDINSMRWVLEQMVKVSASKFYAYFSVRTRGHIVERRMPCEMWQSLRGRQKYFSFYEPFNFMHRMRTIAWLMSFTFSIAVRILE